MPVYVRPLVDMHGRSSTLTQIQSCADTSGDGIVPHDLLAIAIPELAARETADIDLQFIALRSGVQRLPDIVLLEAGAIRPLDSTALSILVH